MIQAIQVRAMMMMDDVSGDDDAMHALERLADVTAGESSTNQSNQSHFAGSHDGIFKKYLLSDFQILGRLPVEWQAMLSLQQTHIESGGPNFWSLKESRIYMVSME
jgi:hypothetical protein